MCCSLRRTVNGQKQARSMMPLLYQERVVPRDRKSTRLNSSHSQISYAVFCLKKKKNKNTACVDTSVTKATTTDTSLAIRLVVLAVRLIPSPAVPRPSTSLDHHAPPNVRATSA